MFNLSDENPTKYNVILNFDCVYKWMICFKIIHICSTSFSEYDGCKFIFYYTTSFRWHVKYILISDVTKNLNSVTNVVRDYVKYSSNYYKLFLKLNGTLKIYYDAKHIVSSHKLVPPFCLLWWNILVIKLRMVWIL